MLCWKYDLHKMLNDISRTNGHFTYRLKETLLLEGLALCRMPLRVGV